MDHILLTKWFPEREREREREVASSDEPRRAKAKPRGGNGAEDGPNTMPVAGTPYL